MLITCYGTARKIRLIKPGSVSTTPSNSFRPEIRHFRGRKLRGGAGRQAGTHDANLAAPADSHGRLHRRGDLLLNRGERLGLLLEVLLPRRVQRTLRAEPQLGHGRADLRLQLLVSKMHCWLRISAKRVKRQLFRTG